MDSGNSGSLQSSSGGDEEYDSLLPSSAPCNTISTTTTHHHPPPPPPPSTSLYDTLSYYDSFPRSPPNPFLHLETPWSRTPSSTDITGLLPTSTTTTTTNPFSITTSSKPSPTQPDPPPPPPPPPRNSKKRSRASRRAPTTVLTTDTSNFRAMVQEFTGIPTSPFATPSSSSSSFPRSRLDIFSGRSSFNDSLLSPPPYLLRPFPQKLQPSSSFPPLSSSSSSSSSSTALNATASTLNASTIARPTSSCTTNPNPTNNFQLSPNHHHHHHHLGLTMQNQMFTFQSLLQPPINSLSSIPAFTDKSRSNDHHHHHHQVIPDLGVSNLDHGDVNNLTGNLSSLVGSAEGGDCKINF